jgi:hypothetical protein
MKPLFILFVAVCALPPAISSAHADPVLTLPYTEDFSNGSEGFNASTINQTLDFNNITYSVDGSGGVAIFDVVNFLGAALDNFSGLGVIGDYQWTGDTTHDVHNFTLATSGGAAFALNSLDWATGNEGPPTVYTITGYLGATQMAQVTDVDIAGASTTYNVLTGSEISATDIGPGDDSGYGQHLVFTGADWGNIDRLVFTATGNDIVVALDNIQLTAPIPEPSTSTLLAGAAILYSGIALRRRKPIV